MPRRSTGHFVYNCARLRKSLKTFLHKNRARMIVPCWNFVGEREKRGAPAATNAVKQTADYPSFSTLTLICAVTSRNTLMVTCDSPMTLMGSASCTWRLSVLNPCAASPSAMSAVVRAKHLIVLAGFARELQRCAVQQFSLLLPGLEFRRGLLGQRGANALDSFQVACACLHREFARQQIIARVAGFDGHHVAAVPQLIDVFLKNDLHLGSLSSCVHQFQVSSSK